MAVADLFRTFSSLLLHSSAKLPQTFSSLCLSRCLHSSNRLDGKMKLIKQGIDLSKYTLHPHPLPRSGGRGHDGRIWTHGVGGGHRKNYRMIDFKRLGPAEGEPMVERVMKVRYDPCRSADIAIVAGGNHKRYILASQNMKAGDLIKTSGKVTRIAVRASEGGAYPVGSLPLGSVVHNVERFASEGGLVARAAGTSAQLVRKILFMSSQREVVPTESNSATPVESQICLFCY